ncbi:DUF1513 domain-containing protein [Sulfitobacter aestuarii]|uniref:DUF1513 domain-containing protein n=1 Tax=Sulfitobacter aestuarii TaxID=2161676 RepID=A0ABW5U0R2_9RHOB
MTTRRAFLSTMLAAGLAPRLGWADVGCPDFLAAARLADGSHALFGMGADGSERFAIPLPGRGHAAAAHPTRPEAVAFARRPGSFALISDCASGTLLQSLQAPAGRHFYGHGCFSGDGALLFTTENDFEHGTGRIGIWAREENYRRIGEFSSGGIGPHDILRLPGQDVLVVANGGIRTHPDHGREKLNLDEMSPSLTYLTPSGALLDRVMLPDDLRQNSIRHLAAREDGLVAFAMQWQGEPGLPLPLLGLHRRGGSLRLGSAPEPEQIAMAGYVGSIAFNGSAGRIALTSPRGGRAHLFDDDGDFLGAMRRPDICGIGATRDGFVATDGLGGISILGAHLMPQAALPRAWDNHLVTI